MTNAGVSATSSSGATTAESRWALIRRIPALSADGTGVRGVSVAISTSPRSFQRAISTICFELPRTVLSTPDAAARVRGDGVLTNARSSGLLASRRRAPPLRSMLVLSISVTWVVTFSSLSWAARTAERRTCTYAKAIAAMMAVASNAVIDSGSLSWIDWKFVTRAVAAASIAGSRRAGTTDAERTIDLLTGSCVEMKEGARSGITPTRFAVVLYRGDGALVRAQRKDTKDVDFVSLQCRFSITKLIFIGENGLTHSLPPFPNSLVSASVWVGSDAFRAGR